MSETRQFDAKVDKILQLMIHSLYTNKDIFIRELISNASDACDKRRYLGQTNPDLLPSEENPFKITITTDEEKKLFTIADNGVGMDKQDLIDNLGTIASSGTQAFLENMTGENNKDMQLIGQFGVGFYSSFMVADKVDVISRKAGSDEAWHWSSEGNGEFTIEKAEATPEVGTSITLHLREEAGDYTDRFRVKHVVETYSDHISIPLAFIDAEGKEESLNEGSALWARPKSEITEEQYHTFFKHVAHAIDKPWMTLHNRNEGMVEFTNLLFIPTKKPFDLFHPDRKTRVKLYVKRIFITEESDTVKLIPAYLRFLQGVVDSEDLPLNISRETLQHNHTIEKIRKAIVSRVLKELKNKAESDKEGFTSFWNEFGAVLKEGLCEGLEARDELLEVCRFKSSTRDGLISLQEYVDNMKEGQEHIYYMNGDDAEKMKNSPQLEGFANKGIEVLLLTDSVDDFWVNVVHEFKEKELKSITRADISLDDVKSEAGSDDDTAKKEETPEEASMMDTITGFIKTHLGERVKDVRVSQKLASSPVCLVVDEGGMDMRLERFLVEQNQLPSTSAKILEVNSKHPIVKAIGHQINENDQGTAGELVELLFDQALIIEGEKITDTGNFTRRMNLFLEKAVVKESEVA